MREYANALGPCTGVVTKAVRGKMERILAGYVESCSEIPKALTDKRGGGTMSLQLLVRDNNDS